MVENNTKIMFDLDKGHDVNDLYPSVKKALNKIAQKEGFKDYKMYARSISTDGGNYLAVLYEVKIEGNTERGRKGMNLFVKHVMHDIENLKAVSMSEIYGKEIFAYRDLSKVFTQLENEAEVPVEERFKMVKSYDESNIDAIILENVSIKGFKTYGRMDVMSPEYARLCVQQLAKFHGLSFVIEKQMPEYFETKIKSLKQSIVHDENFHQFVTYIHELSSARLSPDIKTKVDKRMTTLFDFFVKCAQGSVTSVKGLCHGDFKMNNVLFKDNEGEIAEVITVDYQLMYYGSPITDLIIFLFTASDREFRKNHMIELKVLYYEALKSYLEYFDISANDIYPRKLYEEDFKICLDYGFMTSTILLPFLFTTKEDIPDFGKNDLKDMKFTVVDEFYDRYQGIIDDFIEWGLI